MLLIFISASGLEGRERDLIAVLPVEVLYPARGKEWIGHFLQDELSRQFQLQKNYSALSPRETNRWFHDDDLDKGRRQNFLESVKPQWTLKLELQLVLKQLSLTGSLKHVGKNIPVRSFKKILPFENPDSLLQQVLNSFFKKEPKQELLYHPQGFSWKGLEAFYSWKHQIPVPSVNSEGWNTRSEELEILLVDFPALAERLHYEKAVILIMQASASLPVYVPTLNHAETELKHALSMRPESSDYHTLFSLIYYLRQEKMHAKAEAVIANAENPRNGRALILYGLSIGRKAKDGDAYIRQGLIWYPMNREAPSVYPDPFEVLIPDLAPWLVGNRSSDPPQYQQLMDEARELYIHGEWKKSKRFFEDAWALEPELSEAPLYLARIKIAEKDLKGAMKSLNNLRKRFPEDAATVLFQGYVYELLKKFGNAEILYRKSLEMEPENHRAMLRLSTLLIKTGKYEEARSFLESLTRKYPDYTVGWWNLGLLYQKIDELESAEQALEEVVRLDPANTRVQAQLEHLREELERNISQ